MRQKIRNLYDKLVQVARDTRQKVDKFLIYHVCRNQEEGVLYNLPGRIVLNIFYPFDWLYMRNSRIRWDVWTDRVTIDGVQFSRHMIRDMVESPKGAEYAIVVEKKNVGGTANFLLPDNYYVSLHRVYKTKDTKESLHRVTKFLSSKR